MVVWHNYCKLWDPSFALYWAFWFLEFKNAQQVFFRLGTALPTFVGKKLKNDAPSLVDSEAWSTNDEKNPTESQLTTMYDKVVSFLPTTTVNGKPRSSKDKLTVSYARKFKSYKINNQSKQEKRRGARHHSACSQYIFKIIFKLACHVLIGIKFNDDPPHVKQEVLCVHTFMSRLDFRLKIYAHNLFHPAWWTKFAG